MATDTKDHEDSSQIVPAVYGFPASPTTYEVKRWALQEAYLAEFAKCGAVYKAAAAAGCSAVAAENWLRMDSFAFQKRFTVSKGQYLEKMAIEADRRGMEGVAKPVYQGGKLVGTVQTYSDNLLMFRMKKLDPSYRDSFTLVLDSRDTKDLLDELRRAGEARPAIVDGESQVIDPKPTSEPPEAT